MEGIKKSISLVASVLKARGEGLGFDATCRTFGIAKNTLLDWERRFADLKETFLSSSGALWTTRAAAESAASRSQGQAREQRDAISKARSQTSEI
jgi:transposase-like protein